MNLVYLLLLTPIFGLCFFFITDADIMKGKDKVTSDLNSKLKEPEGILQGKYDALKYGPCVFSLGIPWQQL